MGWWWTAIRVALVVAVLAGGAAGAVPGERTVDLYPSFSPDGKVVAFYRATSTDNGGIIRASIMLVGADGRGLRTLVPEVFTGGFDWSPDGSALVYAADGELRVVAVATGETRTLTAHTDRYGAGQPSWSPLGDLVAYVRGDECFRCTAIWLVGADGSDDHRLLRGGRRPQFSPLGDALVMSFGPSLVVDLEGNEVLPANRTGYAPYAGWSPRAAYAAHTGDGLWIVSVETGRTRRVTPFVNEKPSWSPDGRVIAGGSRGRVALVRVRDGKMIVRFAGSAIGGGVPSWSPAGQVVFVREGNCGVDLAREDGTHRRRLTRAC